MTAAYWWFTTAGCLALCAVWVAAWWDVHLEVHDQPCDRSTHA